MVGLASSAYDVDVATRDGSSEHCSELMERSWFGTGTTITAERVSLFPLGGRQFAFRNDLSAYTWLDRSASAVPNDPSGLGRLCRSYSHARLAHGSALHSLIVEYEDAVGASSSATV